MSKVFAALICFLLWACVVGAFWAVVVSIIKWVAF